LRLPLDFFDKLENAKKIGKFPSVAEALRSYAKVGMRVESFKKTIKDPEFLKSIEELKQTEGVFEWIETLSDSEEDAILQGLEMDKEKRFQNARFR